MRYVHQVTKDRKAHRLIEVNEATQPPKIAEGLWFVLRQRAIVGNAYAIFDNEKSYVFEELPANATLEEVAQ